MTDADQAGERRSPGSSPLAASPPVKQPATPGIWPGGEANQIQLIRVDHLHASALNPRKHFAAEPLAELAASICAQGLLQNLVARPHPKLPGAYELAAGERRWRAAKLAVADGRLGADYALPVAVRALDDASMTATGLAENAARHDLTPLEEARAYGALAAAGADTAHIARLAGRSQRHVQLRLDLLKRLAPPALQALEAGAITAEQARVLCRAPKERQQALVEELIPDADGEVGIVTAAELARAVQDRSIAAGAALFPLQLYKGEWIEDAAGGEGRGQRFFADARAFIKLQKSAIAACRAGLAKRWPWADLAEDEHDHGVDYLPHPYRKAEKKTDVPSGRSNGPAAPGAVIVVNWNTGAVQVHEGVLDWNREQKARAAAAKAKAKTKSAPGAKAEPFDKYKFNGAVTGARWAAIRAFVRAGGGEHAQRLVALLALGHFQLSLDPPADGPRGEVQLPAPLAPLAKLAPDAAWSALGKLGGKALDDRLAAAVAAMLAGYDNDGMALLGAVIGAAVHPAAVDKKFLDLCGPDQRAAMAKELGVELKALKPAAARAALLAAARKRKDYVPAFLRFPAAPPGQSTGNEKPNPKTTKTTKITKRAKGKS